MVAASPGYEVSLLLNVSEVRQKALEKQCMSCFATIISSFKLWFLKFLMNVVIVYPWNISKEMTLKQQSYFVIITRWRTVLPGI